MSVKNVTGRWRYRGRRVKPFFISCYANLLTGFFSFPNKEKKEVKKERKKRKKEKKKGRKERDLLRLKLCNLSHWSVNSIEIQQSKRQTCKKAGETILKCQQKEAYRLSGTLRRTAEVCIVLFTPTPHLPFREVK